MTEATPRYTLALPARSLAGAEALADTLEADFRIDAMAVAINETDEARSLWETVAYFSSAADAETARAVLAVPGAVIAPVPGVDWVRRSLEGLAPVAAGRFYLHGSHDRTCRREGGISLEIDAGTAFGTGHHGTTAGCLVALDRILKQFRPDKIMDLGCGTGVLAIAAARATGRPVLATDIDPEAVRVTLANARANGAAHLVRGLTAPGLKHRAIAEGAPFDLVLANILARPLVAMAAALAASLEPGGHLVLSGLTADQIRWVAAAYRNRGLIPVATSLMGQWATLVFRRPGQKKSARSKQGIGRTVTGNSGPGWEEA